MKTIVLSLLGITVLYVLTIPACQYRALQRAAQAAEREDFESARGYVLPLLEERHNFFTEKSAALCGQLSIQEAEALSTQSKPDYASAARLLSSQAERCQDYTHADTERVLKQVAMRHLEQATALCTEKAFPEALQTFEDMAALAYPEPVLVTAAREAAWCRLASVREHADKEWFDEAIEELGRAMHSGNNQVRRAGLDLLPYLLKREMGFWVEREQFVRAFERLEERKGRFGQEPEVGSLFTSLERQMEMEVFGVVLASSCLGQPAQLSGRVAGAGAERAETLPANMTDNLTVANATPNPLQVIFRGPQRQEMEIAPKKKESLQLPEGAYLVGVWSPGQCAVKPERAVWKVEAYIHHTIEVVMRGHE